MGQATVDLPDPEQKAGPAEAKSADDLLSQMAGDEIDRLLAEGDGELPPLQTSAIQPTTKPDEPVATAGAIDLDAVLETAAAERTESAERAALNPPVVAAAKPVVHAPQIELGDPIRPLPLLLRPLQWISAPLDPWPDQLREIMGKVGLLTIINALAVLAYVFLFRKHHH